MRAGLVPGTLTGTGRLFRHIRESAIMLTAVIFLAACAFFAGPIGFLVGLLIVVAIAMGYDS